MESLGNKNDFESPALCDFLVETVHGSQVENFKPPRKVEDTEERFFGCSERRKGGWVVDRRELEPTIPGSRGLRSKSS
jgi:hypothetical protein